VDKFNRLFYLLIHFVWAANYGQGAFCDFNQTLHLSRIFTANIYIFWGPVWMAWSVVNF